MLNEKIPNSSDKYGYVKITNICDCFQAMANAAMAAQAAEVQAQQVQEIPKEPIPTEHQVLQDIFDSLVRSCSSAANNPVSNYSLTLLY